MKLNFLNIGAAIMLAGSIISCNNAEYQPIGNRMYLAEAATGTVAKQQVERLTVKGDISTDIHARLAQPADKDVTVTFGIDHDFLARYNEMYGTNYLVLPEEYLTLPEKAVIPAGQTTSSAVTIGISEYSTPNGESYCIPVRITGNDGGYEITEASGHLIYILTAPLRQFVPSMVAATVPKAEGGWGIVTPEWTIEAWVWMGRFGINNQAIFTGEVSEGTEIYVRFGDANVPYDMLQLKTGGSQMESKSKFEPEKWYHLAITYANGKCTLYINGEEDVSKEFTPCTYVINNLTLCGSGSYFRTTGKMAQVRFWKKALSGSVIKDAMNGEVPATSDGLFGYWKLNEGEGDIFHDSTSNGYHMTCAAAPSWSAEKVDFSEPNAQN